MFAHNDKETKKKKILINIRFKNIETCYVEDEIVHIKLKGLQEILVEAGPKNQKKNLQIFKEYLTNRRDKTRQKELKFIHHYLDIYYQDNLEFIQKMGEAEIDCSPMIEKEQN